MAELRWIQTSLFLILMLHFTAVTGQDSYITVRDGAEVTLSCGTVMTDQDKCDSITWFFTSRSRSTSVELVESGKIVEEDKSKSDRLSVTANCSLVIKKVTVQDAGYYTCIQQPRESQDFHVLLSVVTMTEQKETDKLTLNCSVSISDQCRYRVELMFMGQVLVKDRDDIKISQSTCSAAASFLTSHHIYTSNPQLLKCRVTDPNGKSLLSDFSPQKPGQDGKTTTMSTTTGTTKQTNESSEAASTSIAGWWRLIIVSVGLTSLISTVVAVNIWVRIQEHKHQKDDDAVRDGEDGNEGSVTYENVGEGSASIRLH